MLDLEELLKLLNELYRCNEQVLAIFLHVIVFKLDLLVVCLVLALRLQNAVLWTSGR